MKQRIKLIIFDCYGAVLSRGYPDTVNFLAKKYHLPEKKLFNRMYFHYFNQAAERKIGQKQAWQKTIDEFNIPMTAKELHDLHIRLFKINKKVLDLAKKLRKDYKILVLSKNTRSQFSDTKKKFPQVWKGFDAVINTWELNLPKASKKTIQAICKIFKVRPEEIVYIDDQMNNLVEAKKMGVKTIFYKNFDQFKKELGRYIN